MSNDGKFTVSKQGPYLLRPARLVWKTDTSEAKKTATKSKKMKIIWGIENEESTIDGRPLE